MKVANLLLENSIKPFSPPPFFFRGFLVLSLRAPFQGGGESQGLKDLVYRGALLLICFGVLCTLPSNADNNPYSSGGSQYNGAYSQNSNPYSSNVSTQSSSTYQAATTDTATNPQPSDSKPWNKVGQWFERKNNQKVTGKPEIDLAHQRIQAGKARIKAVKAREKLEKQIANSKLQTEELTREAEKAEEQASLLENQVKFQESNLSGGR